MHTYEENKGIYRLTPPVDPAYGLMYAFEAPAYSFFLRTANTIVFLLPIAVAFPDGLAESSGGCARS